MREIRGRKWKKIGLFEKLEREKGWGDFGY